MGRAALNDDNLEHSGKRIATGGHAVAMDQTPLQAEVRSWGHSGHGRSGRRLPLLTQSGHGPILKPVLIYNLFSSWNAIIFRAVSIENMKTYGSV
jgi:hypothetical protein